MVLAVVMAWQLQRMGGTSMVVAPSVSSSQILPSRLEMVMKWCGVSASLWR